MPRVVEAAPPRGAMQLVLGSHKRAMRVPKDVLKLLAWLEGGRVSEAGVVEAGLSHTLDKALMRNLAEMNLREATVSITARGRDALSKFPVTRPRTAPAHQR